MSKYWCRPSPSSDCSTNSCCAVVDQHIQRTFQPDKDSRVKIDTTSARQEPWRIENILENGQPPVESDWWSSSPLEPLSRNNRNEATHDLSDFPSSVSLGTSLTESDERSEIIFDNMTDLTRIQGNNISAVTETSSAPTLGQEDENNRVTKYFRNVGRECFERGQSEWKKSTKEQSPSVERPSASPTIPYDHLVQIFIANVNANRFSVLPEPLSLVDAVEILSTAWESDAASSYD